MTSTDPPPPDEARPDEVEFALRWRADGDAALSGELVVRNVGNRVWRLTGKPGIVLIDAQGRDLDQPHVVTLEMRLPGYVLVGPGATATAPVRMSGWDGTPLSESVGVAWADHRATARATGPREPAVSGRGSHTSSSWFALD